MRGRRGSEEASPALTHSQKCTAPSPYEPGGTELGPCFSLGPHHLPTSLYLSVKHLRGKHFIFKFDGQIPQSPSGSSKHESLLATHSGSWHRGRIGVGWYHVPISELSPALEFGPRATAATGCCGCPSGRWPASRGVSGPALSRYFGFQQEASISLAPIRALRLKEAQWARASPARPRDPDDRAKSKLPGLVSLGMHWAPLMCLPAVLKDRPSCPTRAT